MVFAFFRRCKGFCYPLNQPPALTRQSWLVTAGPSPVFTVVFRRQPSFTLSWNKVCSVNLMPNKNTVGRQKMCSSSQRDLTGCRSLFISWNLHTARRLNEDRLEMLKAGSKWLARLEFSPLNIVIRSGYEIWFRKIMNWSRFGSKQAASSWFGPIWILNRDHFLLFK